MHQHNAFQNDEARIIYLRYALLRDLRGGNQPKDLPREFLLLGIGASILSAKLLQSYQSHPLSTSLREQLLNSSYDRGKFEKIMWMGCMVYDRMKTLSYVSYSGYLGR